VHFYCLFNLLVLFYFNTFTPKWFALDMAAVSAELRAILLYKMHKILQFCAALLIPLTMANSAQNTVRAKSQNSDIPS